MTRPVTDDDIGLRVLHEPVLAEATEGDQILDIVAIHGIGAHPDDAWSKPCGVTPDADGTERSVNWLSDPIMLPRVVPNARIMRYGYKSAWAGASAIKHNTSQVANRFLLAISRERREYPSRPLIIIAHCFGGLVVLRALLQAHNSSTEWQNIFKSTTGLIFLGTPFRGAEGLSQSEMLQAALSQYDQREVHAPKMEILDPGNELLQDLVDNFGQIRSQPYRAEVACFFELEPSDIGALVGTQRKMRFMVSENSGCLDVSEATTKYSLARSHSDLNRFSKPFEEDFLTVSEVVQRMATAAPDLLLMRDQFRQGHDQMLGNLSYVEDDHVWAIELGQFMGCYELATHNGRHHRQIPELEREINWRLSAHGISYSLPDQDSDTGPSLTTKLSRQLIRVLGPAHCAFFLIGEAACILREGSRFATDEQKSDIREVARQRLYQVRYQCTGISLDCRAFWDVMIAQTLEDLTTPRLKALFFPDFRQRNVVHT